jgi:hypothetical protein
MRSSRIGVALRAALAIALLASIALVGCSSPSTSATAPSANGSASTAPPETGGSMAAAPVAMGEATKSGDWGLTVKSLTMAPEAGGATAASGKELAVITYDLTNNAAQDAGTGQTDFKLETTDGTAGQIVPTQGEEFIFNTPQPIKAGETRTIKIVYEVPAGSKEFKLTFAPWIESGLIPVVVDVK